MPKNKNIHQQARKERKNLIVNLDGHNYRIKEQRKIIKDAKREIRMHKLLKKQLKTAFKLKQLEK